MTPIFLWCSSRTLTVKIESVPQEKKKSLLAFRAGNSLICSSVIRSDRSNQMSDSEQFAQIAQDKWATVSKSLRSLISKEQPWASCLGHSWQISDCERFAQVAHDKWGNERITRLFWAYDLFFLTKLLVFSEQIAQLLFSSQKTSNSL